MEIRNLITFIKVADFNSFSKASADLGYTQSTVTTQIKMLEAELNTMLFDRVNKTVKLTENGKILLNYARDIVLKADEAKQILSVGQEISGELSIGVFESVCSAFLPEILGRFHSIYPMVNINIVTGTYKELEYQLNSNKIDAIWVFDHCIDVPEWEKILNRCFSLVVVSSPLHPLAEVKEITIEMLEKENFIFTEKCCGYRQMFENEFTDIHHRPKVVLEVDNTEIIKKFILAGLGLGLLPSFLVRDEERKKEISILNVKNLSISMYSQLFYHKNKWVSPAMNGFF